MGRKHMKPRLIPEQDQKICGSICFCQLTMILSCVSIVYLSVAIYSPALKAFKSGFEPEPIMCQTIGRLMPNNCVWASCGEWCLTKTSGFCPQIHATARRNGTDIQFNNCTRINTTQCPLVDTSKYKIYNCNNGTICSNLRGLFTCKNGHCSNISEFLECNHRADGMKYDPERQNRKLNGHFECDGSKCRNISKPFKCDRYCPRISTSFINVLIMHENSVTTADCEVGYAYTEAQGNEHHKVTPATQFWQESDGMLLTNCLSLDKDPKSIDTFNASDCLNGTILDPKVIPYNVMNFSQLWHIYEHSDVIFDPTQRYLPKQSNVTMIESTKLYINLEGCVNTLKGECKDFVDHYGGYGENHTAQSRYQCYYNKNDNSFVIARYDLDTTYKQFLVALILPTVFFVISSIALCIITKSVKVGDDSKMRCLCCSPTNNENIVNDDYYNDDDNSKLNYEIDNLPNDDNNLELIREQSNRMDSHEMIGSTKSLIPLSPCDETTIHERSFVVNDNNNPTPTMIITTPSTSSTNTKNTNEHSLPLVII